MPTVTRLALVRFAIATVLLTLTGVASAEVKVRWKRNADDAATRQFKFEGVPAPTLTDAAVNAEFKVIAGRLDGNGAQTNALHDGELPSNADQPNANLFFAAGAEGGRLLIDLKDAIEIKQINSYSWHPNARGPQVYELFGSDGRAKAFKVAAAREGDPKKLGWTHIASVDTSADSGNGGQYGVSIADDKGNAIGKYRYLLLIVSRTEDHTPFGNTFYSEIDVVDGKEHKPIAPPKPQPLLISAKFGEYQIDFDITEMPEFRTWVEKDLKPVCEKWYPKIVAMLPSDGYAAPKKFTITFRANMRGVAYASRGGIFCAGEWFKRNLQGEAVGAVVHEMVHIVQRYRVRGGARNPGWMVEGLADYIRWFLYEPPNKRPRVNPARAKYTDSYRTTAAFLNYIVEHHDKDAIKKFNAAMREGKYADTLWKDYTGKTVDELWEAYVKTLR